MTRYLRLTVVLVAWLFIPMVVQAALGPGDIAFTLFDADNNEGTGEGDDQFAFVALTDIAETESIYFRDDEWDGSAFNTGEGTVLWTPPTGGLAAGSVVSFTTANELATSIGTVDREHGSLNFATNRESVWAYQGEADAPTSFLAAMNTNSEGFLETLDGTGLTAGVNAIQLLTNADHAQYTGARTGQSSLASYLSLIADVENQWTQENGVSATDLMADTTPFTITGTGGVPGDYNSDIAVNAADYTVWRDNLGGDENAIANNGDGLDGVDAKDYDLWAANYGVGVPTLFETQTVPEPAGLALLAGLWAALALRGALLVGR